MQVRPLPGQRLNEKSMKTFAEYKAVAVLLAAGGGTRMRSRKPKTLHQLFGSPMVSYPTRALAGSGVNLLLAVVGVKARRVAFVIKKYLPEGIEFQAVRQKKQLGTADAVKAALSGLKPCAGQTLLVLPADAPLIRTETLRGLLESHAQSGNTATLLTAVVPDPTGYGRVIRDSTGQVQKIVEHLDATKKEQMVNEICTSIYCFSRDELEAALKEIQPSLATGEYYLTDAIAEISARGLKVGAVCAPSYQETLGVNNVEQFQTAKELLDERSRK